MGKPAARLSDKHTCPMVTGLVAHEGGPIAAPCCPTVLIGGLAAARAGDAASCTGPTDKIESGSRTVLIGGKPAARKDDGTDHGGVIASGLASVLIGDDSGAGGGGGAPSAGSGTPIIAAAAQAKTLIDAARRGSAFCERCSG